MKPLKPMKKVKIPTPEDFERADKRWEEKSRICNAVSEAVRREFVARGSLHKFFVMNQIDVDFRSYIFFKTENDLVASKLSGIREQIENFVYQELERAGGGKRGSIRLAFEYDSDENVKTMFKGDYVLRLE
jgi:hypothetical protein